MNRRTAPTLHANQDTSKGTARRSHYGIKWVPRWAEGNSSADRRPRSFLLAADAIKALASIRRRKSDRGIGESDAKIRPIVCRQIRANLQLVGRRPAGQGEGDISVCVRKGPDAQR